MTMVKDANIVIFLCVLIFTPSSGKGQFIYRSHSIPSEQEQKVNTSQYAQTVASNRNSQSTTTTTTTQPEIIPKFLPSSDMNRNGVFSQTTRNEHRTTTTTPRSSTIKSTSTTTPEYPDSLSISKLAGTLFQNEKVGIDGSLHVDNPDHFSYTTFSVPTRPLPTTPSTKQKSVKNTLLGLAGRLPNTNRVTTTRATTTPTPHVSITTPLTSSIKKINETFTVLRNLDVDLRESQQNNGRPRPNRPPVEVLRTYRYENDDGSITWGYKNQDGSFKEETTGTDCVVRGKNGYFDEKGVLVQHDYMHNNGCSDSSSDGNQPRNNNKKVHPTVSNTNGRDRLR